MGLEDDADTFAIFIRPALFTDKEAGDEYIENTPATILRLTPNTTAELDPYGYPVLRAQGNRADGARPYGRSKGTSTIRAWIGLV